MSTRPSKQANTRMVHIKPTQPNRTATIVTSGVLILTTVSSLWVNCTVIGPIVDVLPGTVKERYDAPLATPHYWWIMLTTASLLLWSVAVKIALIIITRYFKTVRMISFYRQRTGPNLVHQGKHQLLRHVYGWGKIARRIVWGLLMVNIALVTLPAAFPSLTNLMP
jgi:hypothetical protein